MKKLLATLVLLLFTTVVLAQNKTLQNSASGVVTNCECSKLVLFPYFYYQDPNLPDNSSLLLRFDFQHKGIKCMPEFKNSITIYRSPTQTVTIPMDRLTSSVNTMGQRIFVIPQSILGSLRPMTVGGNYKITFSLGYGTSICPATTAKIVRFAKNEPIL
jgi:hypothetical protein